MCKVFRQFYTFPLLVLLDGVGGGGIYPTKKIQFQGPIPSPRGLLSLLSPIFQREKKRRPRRAALEKIIVSGVLYLELPPEYPYADQTGAEEEEGGGFGDGVAG